MYLLSKISRASDLIVKAARRNRVHCGSGLLVACFASIVLAAPVTANAQTQAPATPSSEQLQIENQVDINTADAETLALALDGVGMAKAQDIIAYREQNGDFKTADDLQKVRGIGKATLERNRSRIIVVSSED
ncbi:MAG: ComEA family DNA-binding protein [Gammaproteobacteria bacterium]|nr:ComEA family DNA-binding protein [Gammaproteobacteria bacterium]